MHRNWMMQGISSKKHVATLLGVLIVGFFAAVSIAEGYSTIRREAEDTCNEFYNNNMYLAYNPDASDMLEIGFDSPLVQGYVTFPVTVNTGGVYFVRVRARTTNINANNTISVDVNTQSFSYITVTGSSFQRYAANQQPNRLVTGLNYVTVAKSNIEAGTYVVIDKVYVTDDPVGEVIAPIGTGDSSSSACATPSCIHYAGIYTSQPATGTANACQTGSYMDLTDTSTLRKRSCTATGSAAVVCEANKPHCGDAVCNNGETCTTCQQDCGACPIGGDCKDYAGSYYTQPASNTTNGCRSGTYQDTGDLLNQRKWLCLGTGGGANDLCIAARLYCGDAQCSAPYETCSNCPGDCGTCGGTTADCYPYTGVYADQPAKNTPTGCVVGAYQDTGDTATQRQWLCRGSGGNNNGCYHGAPDGICQNLAGETSANCYDDCGGGGHGGGQVALLCTADKEICGDHICNGVETCTTCSSDCGECPINGLCQLYTGTYSIQPATSTANGCVTGVFLDKNDTDTQRVRLCQGKNGGTDAVCSGNIFFPTISIADAAGVNEGLSSTFVVSLNAPGPFPVDVSYLTYDGTAKAGYDFVGKSSILTIPAGSLTGVIVISGLQDLLDEPIEDFFVVLSNPVNATISDGIAEGTIFDDDAAPTISIADASIVYEGDNSNFLVSLSTGSGLPVSVIRRTKDGTATSGADYVGTTGTLTIPAGFTTGMITIQGLEDLIDEADETFSVILSAPINVTFADMTGGAMIADNDLPPVVSVNSPAAVTEGNQLVFTISLSGTSGLPVTVNYVTSGGTATSGVDYTSVYGTATIAAGMTGTTVTVQTIDDTLDENVENFTLRLLNPVNALSGTMSGTGTINDNDATPTISISTPASVIEGTSVSFVLSLSAVSGLPITVTYTSLTDTATSGVDYTSVHGQVVIPAGATGTTVQVTTINDTIDEADAETFFVSLTNPLNVTIFVGTGLGTILDNDLPPVVSVNSPAAVNEGGQITFTITLNAVSGLPVTVTYYSSGGTATSGVDYTSVYGTATIAAGTTGTTVAVTTTNDSLYENTENFRLVLTSPTNATMGSNPGTGTISDSDGVPAVSVNNPIGVTEGNNVTFTISLSAASGLPVTVNYFSSGGTAISGVDYTSVNGQATIPAGTTGTTVVVTTTNDTLYELNEEFFLVLSSPTNATLGSSPGVGTINDNDAVPVVHISSPAAVTEGTNITFVVSLSGLSGLPVTVDYTTSGGTATEGQDYTGVSSQFTIPAGATGTTIIVGTINDIWDEPNGETFTVWLSNPINTTIGTNPGTGTINDNDTASTVSVNSPAAVTEGANSTFVFSLNRVSGFPITLTYTTSGDTATSGVDYLSVNGELTIPARSTGGTVVVTTVDDVWDELSPERFTMRMSNPVNAVLSASPGTGSINDNDPTPTVNISSPAAVTEGGQITFTVSLSTGSGLPVTVTYYSSGGTALSGVDYTSINGQVSFAPGVTGATVVVQTTDDLLDENTETFRVLLTSPTNATLGTSIGTGTISDDDTTTLSVDDPSGNEGDPITFTVTLSLTSVNTVTVNFATLNGTALSGSDYTSTGGVLSFAPGVTTKTVTVQTIENLIDAPNKLFSLVLSNPNQALIADATGVATIIDDDGTPTLNVMDTSAEEGNNLSFSVALGNPSASDVTFQYTTIQGTATASSDYLSRTGTGTILAGSTGTTVVVTGVEDTLDEPDETMGVVISSPINADLGDANGTGTILDDDTSPMISLGDITVTEAEGTNLIHLSQRLDQWATAGRYTFSGMQAPDGTMTARQVTKKNDGQGDVLRLTLTQPFSVLGTGSYTFSVRAKLADSTPDPNFSMDIADKQFKAFTLTNTRTRYSTTVHSTDFPMANFVDIAGITIDQSIVVWGAQLTQGSGVVAYVPTSGTRAVTGMATLPVSLSAVSAQNITVNYMSSGGSAQAGADYLTKTGTLLIPAGQTGGVITGSILNDLLYESDESYSFVLTNPVNTTISTGVGVVTIQDDDDQPKVSVDSPAAVTEGNNVTFTISLNAVAGLPVTVNYFSSGGTAISGVDYTSVNGQVTIPAGSTSTTVTVQTINDVLYETGEQFTLVLSSPTNATLGTSPGVGTINDNDTAPVVNINSPAAVTEGGNITFVVSLSAVSGLPVTVTYYSSGGTATQGQDYTGVSSQFTIPAGGTGTTIVVGTINDTRDELSPETFTVRLSGAINATLGTNPGTGSINDNDNPPTISVNSPTSVTEGTNSTFVLTLSAISGLPIAVNYATSGGTATSGEDYISVNGQAMIPAFSTGTTVVVTTINDVRDELSPERFTFRLSSPTNATIGTNPGTGSINDDDPLPTVNVDSPVAVSEGGQITFTVSLSTGSGLPVTVNYFSSGGTAISGVDYTSVNGQVSFAPGVTGATVVVQTTDDATFEPTEQFRLVLTGPTNATLGTSIGTGTINDNETAPVVSISTPTPVYEGSGLTFVISLNAPSSLTATVIYTSIGGTATSGLDYTSVYGTATIAADMTGTTVVVSTTNDLIDEPDTEYFTVALSSPTNVTIGTNPGTGAIMDNDAQPAIVISGVTVSEAEGTNLHPNANQLGAAINPSTVVYNNATAPDGSQTADTLTYDAPGGVNPGVQMGIPTGTPALSSTVYTYSFYARSVTGNGNINVRIDTDNHSALVSQNVTASSTRQRFQIVFTTDPATSHFTSNSRFRRSDLNPGGVIEFRGQQLEEGSGAGAYVPTSGSSQLTGVATLQVTLSNPSRQTISAQYATVAGSASSGIDYLSKNGTIVFGPGATGTTITGSIINDLLYEPTEQYFFKLTNPANATIATATGTVTILDNDQPPVVSILTPADVNEGEQVVFPVVLSTVSGYPTYVSYLTYDGDALSGSDYVTSSGQVLISAGSTGTTITIMTVNDAVDENTEQFSVRLSVPVNATIGTGVATGTIIDNDLVCGPANGQVTVDPPTTGLCISSTVTGMTIGATDFTRRCVNQTDDISCSSYRTRNGICGSADGQTGSVAPTSGLCFVGNPSPVTLSGALYSRTCAGIYSGSDSSCFAHADEEECDDGNNVSGDGCSAICVMEYCGDGVTDTNGVDNILGTADDEQCDDGNNSNGDSCSSTCKHEYCGDGVVDTDGSDNNPATTGDNELCDPGRFCSDGTGCSANPWICPGDCITRFVGNCSPNCTYGTCGDGYIDPNGADNTTGTADDEQCDGGSFCPNGIPCNHNPSLCPGQCAPIFTTVCLANCKALYCGDGFVDIDGPDNDLTTTADNESCDDGNTLLGDGCNDVCQLEAPDILCEEEFTCPVGYIIKYVPQTQQYYCEQTQYTGATYTP